MRPLNDLVITLIRDALEPQIRRSTLFRPGKSPVKSRPDRCLRTAETTFCRGWATALYVLRPRPRRELMISVALDATAPLLYFELSCGTVTATHAVDTFPT
jgi:hypothetical protein